MIEPGFNGINFGNTSEEEFLNSISSRYVDFFKKFIHRDTQLNENQWRIQGTISIEDFNFFLREENLSNISQIGLVFPSKKDYLITMNILKLK